LKERVANLEAHLARRVSEDEPIPLATWVDLTPYLSDLIWGLRCFKGGKAIALQVAEYAVNIARRAEGALPGISAGPAYRDSEHTRQYVTDAVESLREARRARSSARAALHTGEAVFSALDAVTYAAYANNASAYYKALTARDDIRTFTLTLLGVLP
jgi:hypothetical protein